MAAQSADDAARFVALGARPEQVVALGNLKFDIGVPEHLDAFVAQFRQHVPAARPVWIAASTHDGEEAATLDIHAKLQRRFPDLLLLWAPRHPERFPKVEALARERGWRVATRKAQQWPDAQSQVFVIDTLGELMAFYACAQAAFVGGSLQPIGGHNLLEPAAVGTPSVTGPHLHNFSEISRRMREAGAVAICNDAEAVADALETLLADAGARKVMAEAGLALVANGRGAVQRTLAQIAPHLPPVATLPGKTAC